MLILNPSNHSCQHANQTLTRATPNGMRNTLQRILLPHKASGFCYHIKYFDDTLYSKEQVTFLKEHNDDDVAQIFIDTLEKNIKDIYKQF